MNGPKIRVWLVSLVTMSFFIGACDHPAPARSSPKARAVSQSVKVSDPIPYDSTQWTELTPEMGFHLDIRYATANNFTKEQIYACGRCFLRARVAAALIKMNDKLREKELRIKLYDCYRPAPAQQKLWDKVPNPDYVAPPSEGSMHNRGVAVDLSLEDLRGRELEMGTTYDFFGPEAHQDYTKLDAKVLANRRTLKEAMESAGFQPIRTEWWHFSYSGLFPSIEKWEWSCPGK